MEPELYLQARDLWLEQVAANGSNARVLHNAARFFTLDDRSAAEKLMREAIALEPGNLNWHEQLGHLYLLNAQRARFEARALANSRDRPAAPSSASATARQALNEFEAALGLTGDAGQRSHLLEYVAAAALTAGDDAKAAAYASELLETAEGPAGGWNRGNAIHEGHRILGHVALRAGDVEGAKKHLLGAGQTPGSPQLDSFGPELTLARDLLQKGERDIVIEYLQSVSRFWKGHEEGLEEAVILIRAGKTPELERFRIRRTNAVPAPRAEAQ